MLAEKTTCLICSAPADFCDVVDFNKNCEEIRGTYLPMSGKSVYYARCSHCHFIFAPELSKWSEADFLREIYNEGYAKIDPDYEKIRPESNAKLLMNMFPSPTGIRHLDYGGGNGYLSQNLRTHSWDSVSYDPFPASAIAIEGLGRFNLISSFEVFEHVPQPKALIERMVSLMASECLVLFSTLTTDDVIKDRQAASIELSSVRNWWYASPRNGHISLYSRTALATLGHQQGLSFGSFNANLHCYYNKMPAWAAHMISA